MIRYKCKGFPIEDAKAQIGEEIYDILNKCWVKIWDITRHTLKSDAPVRSDDDPNIYQDDWLFIYVTSTENIMYVELDNDYIKTKSEIRKEKIEKILLELNGTD